jgi:N-dimethylarginine dimethylaminohydrolase
LLVGVGHRTNEEGFRQVKAVRKTMGADVEQTDVGPIGQHLLGLVDILDEDPAAIDAERFVTVAPRRVIMPAGCPGARARLADRGVLATEVDISEYIKAAGAIACATGVVHRASVA